MVSGERNPGGPGEMVSGPVPEGIDGNNVAAWLTNNVPNLQAPLQFSLLAGGHSNLTYRCDDAGGQRYGRSLHRRARSY